MIREIGGGGAGGFAGGFTCRRAKLARTIFFVENVKFQHTCLRSGYTVRIRYTGKIAGDKIHFPRRIGDCATGEPVAKRVK